MYQHGGLQYEDLLRAIRSTNYLTDLSKNLEYSDNIHIILVDNDRFSKTRYSEDNIKNNKDTRQNDIIRNSIIPLLTKLIEKYKGDHVVIVYYCNTVDILFSVLPLCKDIIDHIRYSNIIDYIYNYDKNITLEQLTNAIKTGFILSKPEFKFLVKYENIYIHSIC